MGKIMKFRKWKRIGPTGNGSIHVDSNRLFAPAEELILPGDHLVALSMTFTVAVARNFWLPWLTEVRISLRLGPQQNWQRDTFSQSQAISIICGPYHWFQNANQKHIQIYNIDLTYRESF